MSHRDDVDSSLITSILRSSRARSTEIYSCSPPSCALRYSWGKKLNFAVSKRYATKNTILPIRAFHRSGSRTFPLPLSSLFLFPFFFIRFSSLPFMCQISLSFLVTSPISIRFACRPFLLECRGTILTQSDRAATVAKMSQAQPRHSSSSNAAHSTSSPIPSIDIPMAKPPAIYSAVTLLDRPMHISIGSTKLSMGPRRERRPNFKWIARIGCAAKKSQRNVA